LKYPVNLLKNNGLAYKKSAFSIYSYKVMFSINANPDIRRVFAWVHFEIVAIRYSTANQRQGKADVSEELVIMNWEPAALGVVFWSDGYARTMGHAWGGFLLTGGWLSQGKSLTWSHEVSPFGTMKKTT
jgi:hypothetical protein